MGGPVRRIIERPKPQPASTSSNDDSSKGPTKAETPQYDQSKEEVEELLF